MGIKYEDTRHAIERLIENNNKVNIDTIRIELGNTGSRSTISAHKKKWQDENPLISINNIKQIELPPPIINSIFKVIKENHDNIKSEYSKRIESLDEDIQIFSRELSALKDKYQKKSALANELKLQLHTEKQVYEKLMLEVNNKNKSLLEEVNSLSQELSIAKQNEAVALAKNESKDELIKSLNKMLDIKKQG